MIRKNGKFLTQAYIVSDTLLVCSSLLLAWWTKFRSGWLEYNVALAFGEYFIWTLVYAIAAVSIAFMVQLYSPKRKKSFSFEAMKVIQVHFLSFLVLLAFLFVTKEIHISRQFLAIFLGLNLTLIISYRYILKNIVQYFRQKGYNKQFVLILGAGHLGKRFYHNLHLHPDLGFEVVGFLDDYQSRHEVSGIGHKPILGKIDDLEDVLNHYIIDEVIVALPLYAHEKYGEIIECCEKVGVKTLIIPDFFDVLPARPQFDDFAGMPLINVREIPLEELGNRMLKRGFDLCFSILAIIVTMPLCVAIAVIIKLTSKGPVIFQQERVGLNRRNFMMYKFRTMKVQDKESSDTNWTTMNDTRKTRFGSFLRKTSLDELPQFYNVLLGHMSVVGPRPERPHFVKQFKEEIPKYMIKHHIRPGITGWAQSNGLRGDTSIEKRIQYDLFYIENWSFLLDIKIIMLTFWIAWRNRNAY